MALPSIDELCGRHFRYRELLHCSNTWKATKVVNLPVQLKTYRAMEALCEHVLDPVFDEFGQLKLTHGFCSKTLEREIRGGIAPKLDQHAGYELSKSGNVICPRGGFAADFVLDRPGSLSVAKWIVQFADFDRLYFYGDNRPIHVSVGPDNARDICVMRSVPGTNRRIPRRLKTTDFLAFENE